MLLLLLFILILESILGLICNVILFELLVSVDWPIFILLLVSSLQSITTFFISVFPTWILLLSVKYNTWLRVLLPHNCILPFTFISPKVFTDLFNDVIIPLPV